MVYFNLMFTPSLHKVSVDKQMLQNKDDM